MHISSLRHAVLATLNYFNIFEYPLTLVELHRYLYFPNADTVTLVDIKNTVQELEKSQEIVCTDGLYHLPGKQEYVATRLYRYVLTEKKMNRLRRVVRLLQYIPSITMIAACNSLGFSNGRATSDIDVFIISQPKRIWFTRLKAIVLTSLLGVRLSGEDKQNKICLSFYITSDAMELEKIRKQPEDPYLTYWLASLVPVYGYEQYKTLLQRNSWLTQSLPNYYQRCVHNRRYSASSGFTTMYRAFFQKVLQSPFGAAIEKIVQQIQWKKLRENIKQGAKQDNGHVILTPTMLKFHTTDKRSQYAQQWQESLHKYLS